MRDRNSDRNGVGAGQSLGKLTLESRIDASGCGDIVCDQRWGLAGNSPAIDSYLPVGAAATAVAAPELTTELIAELTAGLLTAELTTELTAELGREMLEGAVMP